MNRNPGKESLLLRDASPVSVISRTSILSALRVDNLDKFPKPPSVIKVNERFKIWRFANPARIIQTSIQHNSQGRMH